MSELEEETLESEESAEFEEVEEIEFEEEQHSTAPLKNQIEALIFASTIPLSTDKIIKSLGTPKPAMGEVRSCLEELSEDYEARGVQLMEVASGWRFQVALDCAPTIVKTLEERPTRLTRALLETLALVAYRQPITRAEIESIRGVVVSTQMVKTLSDHEWIRVVGHKDVPGKPALYATTKTFLDDMGLKRLDELPPLSEIKLKLAPQLESSASQAETHESLEAISALIQETKLETPEMEASEENEEENIQNIMDDKLTEDKEEHHTKREDFSEVALTHYDDEVDADSDSEVLDSDEEDPSDESNTAS